MNSSEEFQQHFSIISKSVCCGFYLKKNVAVTLISFAALKWDDCLSAQLPFELPVQIPVQLLLMLEPNLLVQNVIELEFELSRMSMKPTIEKMMHAKYLSEVRGGNKRIPQCHIQKDWQDYLFAIVQFFCVLYYSQLIRNTRD